MTSNRAMSGRPDPTFAQLCVMAHHVLDALGNDAAASAVIDELKWLCARSGFGYPQPDRFIAAVEAVITARRKGYSTPQRPDAVAKMDLLRRTFMTQRHCYRCRRGAPGGRCE